MTRPRAGHPRLLGLASERGAARADAAAPAVGCERLGREPRERRCTGPTFRVFARRGARVVDPTRGPPPCPVPRGHQLQPWRASGGAGAAHADAVARWRGAARAEVRCLFCLLRGAALAEAAVASLAGACAHPRPRWRNLACSGNARQLEAAIQLPGEVGRPSGRVIPSVCLRLFELRSGRVRACRDCTAGARRRSAAAGARRRSERMPHAACDA